MKVLLLKPFFDQRLSKVTFSEGDVLNTDAKDIPAEKRVILEQVLEEMIVRKSAVDVSKDKDAESYITVYYNGKTNPFYIEWSRKKNNPELTKEKLADVLRKNDSRIFVDGSSEVLQSAVDTLEKKVAELQAEVSSKKASSKKVSSKKVSKDKATDNK